MEVHVCELEYMDSKGRALEICMDTGGCGLSGEMLSETEQKSIYSKEFANTLEFHNYVRQLVAQRVVGTPADLPKNAVAASRAGLGVSYDMNTSEGVATYLRDNYSAHDRLVRLFTLMGPDSEVAADAYKLLSGFVEQIPTLERLHKAALFLGQTTAKATGPLGTRGQDIEETNKEALRLSIATQAAGATVLVTTESLLKYLIYLDFQSTPVPGAVGKQKGIAFKIGNYEIAFDSRGAITTPRDEVMQFFDVWNGMSVIRRTLVWVDDPVRTFVDRLCVVHTFKVEHKKIITGPGLVDPLAMTPTNDSVPALKANHEALVSAIIARAGEYFGRTQGDNELKFRNALLWSAQVAWDDAEKRPVIERSLNCGKWEKHRQIAAETRSLDQLRDAIKTNQSLSVWTQRGFDARDEEKAKRNTLGRESIAKRLCAPYGMDSLPNGFNTAFKAEKIMKNLDWYDKHIDIVGIGKRFNMHRTLCDNPNFAGAGGRALFDIIANVHKKDYTNVADIYAMGDPGSKVGRYLFSDANAPAPENKCVQHQCEKNSYVPLLYSLIPLGYQGMAIKMMYTAKMRTEIQPALVKLRRNYEKVYFQKVGKLQSAEFFIIVDKRFPAEKAITDAEGQHVIRVFSVFSDNLVNALAVANVWMTTCTILCKREPLPESLHTKFGNVDNSGMWIKDGVLRITPTDPAIGRKGATVTSGTVTGSEDGLFQ